MTFLQLFRTLGRTWQAAILSGLLHQFDTSRSAIASFPLQTRDVNFTANHGPHWQCG